MFYLSRSPMPLIARLVGGILPAVARELRGFKKCLQASPSPFLREQALQSMQKKRFHCQGGAVYALLNPAAGRALISFITAFQTISDYLDNLCDRLPAWAGTPEEMEAAFRSLHCALQLALETEETKTAPDYYRLYPYRQDGGYLHRLVQKCRSSAAGFPNFGLVREKAVFLTGLYGDLQTLKHLHPRCREKALKKWFEPYRRQYLYLHWQEFAAAAGSTLGVFALLALASRPDAGEEEREALYHLYFPWICALHILLDYYIDQAEDRREGDLNFVFYYANREQFLQRLRFFTREALARAGSAPDAAFHRTIVQGLLAVYLSDPKIRVQGWEKEARLLLQTAGTPEIYTLYHTCRFLRRLSLL